ncbi:hypothetical protein D3C86_2115260 [compost metagenome]
MLAANGIRVFTTGDVVRHRRLDELELNHRAAPSRSDSFIILFNDELGKRSLLDSYLIRGKYTFEKCDWIIIGCD